MYSNEDHMFGHVGDQLNGLDSRMAGFELDQAHSMNMDPAGPMMNGILANNGSLGGGVGVNESLPGMSVGGAQMGSGAGPSGDMAIKVLVSNKDAGSLIGKNGSTIVSFQALTGSRVRVSRADEPFPGTQERVVLITGSLECVNKCLSLVIEQVHKHFADYPYADKEVQPLDPNAHRTMNLVVPAGASGLIIGRGGDTVRALASKSGSHIQLAGRERQIQGLSERLLCLTGSLAANVAAAKHILQILHMDPSGKYDNVSTSYRGFATSMPAHQSVPAHVPGAHHRAHPAQLLPHTQRNAVRGRRDTAMVVPGGGAMPYARYASNEGAPIFARADYHPILHHGLGDSFLGNGHMSPGLLQHLPPQVPIILGKGGAIMREIQQRSGARIRVSQKGEYVPGTTDRMVTITAPTHQEAHGAYLLVAQKIGIN